MSKKPSKFDSESSDDEYHGDKHHGDGDDDIDYFVVNDITTSPQRKKVSKPKAQLTTSAVQKKRMSSSTADDMFNQLSNELGGSSDTSVPVDTTDTTNLDSDIYSMYGLFQNNQTEMMADSLFEPIAVKPDISAETAQPVAPAYVQSAVDVVRESDTIYNEQKEWTTRFDNNDISFPVTAETEGECVQDRSAIVFFHDIQEVSGQIRIFGRAVDPSSLTEESLTKGINAHEMATRSTCVIVEELDREFFVLPRRYKFSQMHTDASHNVTAGDVYQEVCEILSARGVRRTSVRMKPVQRRYCFERYPVAKAEEPSLRDPKNIVPVTTTEFLHFKYTGPALGDVQSGVFFSHCMNTHTSLLETFMLGRELNEGSCWLTITGADTVEAGARRSKCQLELRVQRAESIAKYRPGPRDPDLPVPLLTTATLHLTTSLQGQQQHIVAAQLRISSKMSLESVDSPHLLQKQFVVICAAPGTTVPSGVIVDAPAQQGKVIIARNERVLLQTLAGFITQFDPDLIVGHELHGALGEVLKAAIRRHAKDMTFQAARFSMPTNDKSNGWIFRLFNGRLLCDTAVSCREFFPTKKYDLAALADVLFKRMLTIPDSLHTKDYFDKTKSVVALMLSVHRQTDLVFDQLRELQVLPLTKTLTEVCGNLLQMSFRAMRSRRIEQLLLHKFLEKGVIPPEDVSAAHKEELRAKADEQAEDDDATGDEQKKGYAGGLVQEPQRGYYDTWVSVLDFNSLYPSIIREYDICHSTLRHWEDSSSLPALQALLDSKLSSESVLPDVMRSLIEKRKFVKRMIATANEQDKAALNIRQQALKLVANAMYGCLGFSHSRFYCQPLAAIITMKGRQAQEFAVDSATKLGRSIIYGDTDSIMVNTHTSNYADARKAAGEIVKVVNGHFKLQKIDEDGYFASMLQLRKKKYAALKLAAVETYQSAKEAVLAREWDEATRKAGGRARVRKPAPEQGSVFMLKREVKGLDLVRRDWCALSRNTCTKIVDIILQGLDTDSCLELVEHLLTDLRLRLQDNKVPYSEFLLTKSQTKSLDQYDGKHNLVHVAVASAMKAAGQIVRAGDVIEYFVLEEPGKALHERAMSHSLYLAQGKPALDVEWYVKNQLFEPVWRLLDTFSLSKDRVGEWLGVPVQTVSGVAAADRKSTSLELPAVCSSFQHESVVYVDCPRCGSKFPFLGVYNYAPVHSFKQPGLTLHFESPNAATAPILMHGAEQYRSRVANFATEHHETHGFICPTPQCPGPLGGSLAESMAYADTVCNSLTLRIESALSEYQKHQLRHKVGEDKLFVSTDLRVKDGDRPQRVVAAEDVLDQIRYISWLFDTEAAAQDLLKEFQSRKVSALELEDKTSSIVSYANLPVSLAKITAQDASGNPVSTVDLKECFDENRKVVVLAPITKDLSENTRNVFAHIHKHIRAYLLSCEKYHIKLASLLKINLKTSQ